MSFNLDKIKEACLKVLSKFEGPNAVPHPDQITAIATVLIDRKRTLLIQPVGWGKSLVYWTLTDMLRRVDEGLIVIVSPLLALMLDQISAARKAGLRIDTWNSTNTKSHDNIRQQVIDDELDVLILTPEQLARPGFIDLIREDVSLLVIDEAHCIPQWGYSFRADYLRISHALAKLPAVRVLATTATATPEIEKGIVKELGGDVQVLRGSLANQSLSFHVVNGVHRDKQVQFLDKALSNLGNGGIIYCYSKPKVVSLAQELSLRGHKVAYYHADVPLKEKRLLEQRWRNNELKAIISTSALGMGINKKDVPFVINIGIQPSITDYFQQAGRAGRNGDEAFAVLITDLKSDKKMVRIQPTNGLPNKTDLTLIYEALRTCRYPISAAELALDCKVDSDDPVALLKLLATQNAVEETLDGWYCIDDAWSFNDELHQAIVEHRTIEVQKMHDYTTANTCLENILRSHLGDTEVSADCGRCSNCKGELPKQFRFGY